MEVRGIEPRASTMLKSHSTTEPHSLTFIYGYDPLRNTPNLPSQYYRIGNIKYSDFIRILHSVHLGKCSSYA